MILHFDEKTFDEAVNGDKPVLVDFLGDVVRPVPHDCPGGGRSGRGF